MNITKTDALIIIDPQVDFCPGGALAVAGGDEIMRAISALAKQFADAGGRVVLTQDWHPQNQISFASNHEGAAPFTLEQVPYGDQVMWPDHCVQGTPGAEFHPDLDVPQAEVIIRKGNNPTVDSYSAFFENDHNTSTGLRGYLAEKGILRCFFVGLAYDFCVAYSALDAVSLHFKSVIVKDLTRAIDLNGSVAMQEDAFKANSVQVINVEDFEYVTDVAGNYWKTDRYGNTVYRDFVELMGA